MQYACKHEKKLVAESVEKQAGQENDHAKAGKATARNRANIRLRETEGDLPFIQ